MKKLSLWKIIIVTIITVLTLGQQAFASFEVDWGNSMDDGKKGYQHLGTWLVGNGYYANQADAENFAKTGYTGFDAGDADPYYWSLSDQFNVQIVQEIAGYKNLNTFGFYTGTDGNKALSQIFGGTDNGPKAMNISDPFGFYISTPDANTWYTDRSQNSNGMAQALIYELNPGTEWLVAFEDLNNFRGSDTDYNDMYVKVTTAAEPVSSTLFVLGGGALVANAWRKRKMFTSRKDILAVQS